MDFEFPPDALMLRDMLRRFVQKEARPLEMKYFTAGELAPEESARLRRSIEQMGLWGLTVPEQFGGGLDLVTCCVIQEELGQTFIPVEIGEVTPVLYSCAGEQVSRYLEPALAGERRVILAAREPGKSRPADWMTNAVPVDEAASGYLLNGLKSISSQPGEGDFFIVFAGIPAGSVGLTAFLLDDGHPGLVVSRNGDITLALRDCVVGPEALLGKPGGALSLGAQEAPRLWIQMGAQYVGIVQRLLEMVVEYTRDWVALGAPLAVRPAIQRMVADISVELEGARWLVYHAAWLADIGQSDSIRLQAAQVRLATGEMLKRAVDCATMMYAGPGPSAQIEPQRLVRSVVPFDALELSMENARAAITAKVLNLDDLGGDS